MWTEEESYRHQGPAAIYEIRRKQTETRSLEQKDEFDVATVKREEWITAKINLPDKSMKHDQRIGILVSVMKWPQYVYVYSRLKVSSTRKTQIPVFEFAVVNHLVSYRLHAFYRLKSGHKTWKGLWLYKWFAQDFEFSEDEQLRIKLCTFFNTGHLRQTEAIQRRTRQNLSFESLSIFFEFNRHRSIRWTNSRR